MNQQDQHQHATDDAHAAHDDHHVHVIPFWTMTAVFVALIFLTLITVLTAKGIYAGNAVNLVIALFIAGIKAVLVAGFFMHLVYDKALNTIVVVATMFAVVLFISLTAIDIGTRGMAFDDELEGEIVPGGGASISYVDDGTEEGTRVVGKKGEYNPWHNDAASRSVLDEARENYKAKKAHDGEYPKDDDN